ncbi:MAG: glycerol acyltransferase [Bacteroidales bacterium]|nr:glycerol acyltransferase [Bacteroidales bacterium]
MINRIEKIIRQDKLNALLESNAGKTGADFCRGILESLDIKIKVRFSERLPSDRRVIFACNHPLGGLDGLALIEFVRNFYGGQVWFIVNDLLMAVKPLENVFLPINKFGTQNRGSAIRIEEAFAGEDPIIIFPAGLVSRYQTEVQNGEKRKVIADLKWHRTFVNKATQYRRDIVPLFFSGTNSMDFYRKAYIRKRLGLKFNIEMILLPREIFYSEGQTFVISVGKVKKYTDLGSARNAQTVADNLREYVYQLGMEGLDMSCSD